MQKTTSLRFTLSIIITFMIMQITSLRPLFKYTPQHYHLLIPAFLLLLLLCYILPFKSAKVKKIYHLILNMRWLSPLLLILIVVMSYILYQHELFLQAHMQGSDNSYAIIESGKALLNGHYPYLYKTYFGNPISPGPGWIILTLPFASTKLYPLLIPTTLTLLLLTLRHCKYSLPTINLFTLLTISTLSFWELLGSGITLIAIGFLFSTIILLAIHYRKNTKAILLISILLGLLATSRIVFLYAPIVIGILIFQKNKHSGIILALTSFTLAILVNVIFFVWNPSHFQPLHLLHKGNIMLNHYELIFTIIACISAFIYFLSCKNNSDVKIFFLAWLSLFVPLACVAFSGLINWRHGQLSLWEGSNYIATCLPLFTAWIACSVGKHFETQLSNTHTLDA